MEKFKRFKEGAKKLLSKVGSFLNKGSKVVEKLQPVVDVVKNFVPYGDQIAEGIKIGQKVAETAGTAMESIGQGKNIGDVIKDTVDRARNIPFAGIRETEPQKMARNFKESIEPDPKLIEQFRKEKQQNLPPPQINNNIKQPQINNNTNRPKQDPQFLSKDPIKPKAQQPSFMNNILN